VPRPRSFDESELVDRAMELFWTDGYAKTSVAEITAHLGVHPGSIYRSFGDKHALFLLALAHYRDDRAATLGPSLVAGGSVMPRLRGVMIGFIELAAEQDQPRGCFLANTAGELLPGHADVRARLGEILTTVEDGFHTGLQLAARQGELVDGIDLRDASTMLTMVLEGLQVIVKADRDPRRLVSAVDLALSALAR
jgi:TetR/AcrR family transcriptional repressor of nem operon